jgi:hypothetical protein
LDFGVAWRGVAWRERPSSSTSLPSDGVSIQFIEVLMPAISRFYIPFFLLCNSWSWAWQADGVLDEWRGFGWEMLAGNYLSKC